MVRHRTRSWLPMLLGCAVPLALACAACGSSGPSDSAQGAAPSTGESPVLFDRTVVHLNPDGTTTVHRSAVTAEVMAAEAAAREARKNGQASTLSPEIAQESCAAADVSLFAYAGHWTNCTGPEICFYGEGTASLAGYNVCLLEGRDGCVDSVPWTNQVQSWQPGNLTSGENGGLCSGDPCSIYNILYGLVPGAACFNGGNNSEITTVELTD